MSSPTRVPLSAFDNIMPRIYAYTIYCLALKPNEDPRIVHGYLQKALLKTVEQIPILGGTLAMCQPSPHDKRKGRLEVVVPQNPDDNPVSLRFRDVTAEMNYEDLMAEGLPDSSLIGELLLPTGLLTDLESNPAVLVAQANFSEGGCFLGVGIHHTVADGGAAVYMMQIWSHYCRQLQSPDLVQPLPAVSQEGLDRSILNKLWLANGNRFDERACQNSLNELWRFLGVNPTIDTPSTSGSSSSPRPPQTETSIFYISGSSFAKLKSAGTTTEKLGVTANDVLMAFLWRGITKARFPPEDSIYAAKETATLDTTVDGRAQLSPQCPQDYFGNVVLMNTTYMSLDSLTSSSNNLGFIASEIRKTLNTIDAQREYAALTLAASIPDCTHLTFPFATFQGTELCITSTVNMPLFHLNFGKAFENDGMPESIRPPKSEFASICRRCVVLPRRTNGGFEVLISLVDDEMRRLKADSEFNQFARFCCH